MDSDGKHTCKNLRTAYVYSNEMVLRIRQYFSCVVRIFLMKLLLFSEIILL